MDDDDVQETGVLGGEGNTTSTPSQGNAANTATTASKTETTPAETTETGGDEAPPAKPPRPLTEAQKNEMILKEAFPSVDSGVIKAVMYASGGRVEPAFNALLGTTWDKSFKPQDC